MSLDEEIPIMAQSMLAIKKNKAPSRNKFSIGVVPFPKLADLVVSCKWEQSKNEIEFRISENENFDVIKWIDYIKEQQKDNDLEVDLNINQMRFEFQDENGAKIATAFLKKLNVLSHECVFNKQSINSSVLSHKVKLKYEKILMQIENDKEKQDNSYEENEEWQEATQNEMDRWYNHGTSGNR